ncbi:amino acid adenylation domain-containing protein [Streptosporangium sp. NPDC001681]|uniref:non-ribosomal peptide synthetase n=1 Tax=Streptosporangium sp. NPDC001681 TaxID=3154395 RepID=UPI0033306972
MPDQTGVDPTPSRRHAPPEDHAPNSGREAAEPYPALPVHELIAAQAARTPDAVAVECRDRRLSYAELMALAGALAGRLRRLGVRSGEPVGVAVPRGVELVAALVGVHLAGAAYLPLDPTHPADRLSYVLDDAGARVLVTSGAGAGGAAAATVVRIDDLAEPRSERSPEPAPRAVVPDDPAYLIYTSGSTGRPKGVLVSHRALTNFLWSMRERPGLAPGTVFPAVTTVSFDIAALELFLPLVVGGRVVVAEPEDARDPERLAALLARIGATVMQATPTTWRLLLDAGWSPPAGFTALCGGERLPAELARRLCAGGARLWDLYGPTETTVWSSVAFLADGEVRDFAPVANTTLHVLDDGLNAVPTGASGELCIGGDGVAVGYHRRPALTADRFVPDPYGTVPGGRLYRTGDVARRHPDGRIEILGRTDDQIKIRGHRIEPGEVEGVLAAHEGVRFAVVQAVEAGTGPRLVAHVQPADPAAPPSARELHLHCARLLPPYLIPADFLGVAEFPTTPNGKIDRAALRAMPADAVPAGREPGTPAERAVAAAFAEVLERPVADAEADFFALGGHSLSANLVVGRLRAERGIELPVAALFEARTVERLAARLETAGRALPPVPVAPRTGPVPLSFAQRRMWFLHQLDPEGTSYLEPLAVRVPGTPDPDRLRAALTGLFERHEILRTRYPAEGDGEPAQVVEPAGPVPVRIEDGDPRQVLAEEMTRPFDLSAAPPVRVRVVRGPGGEHTVLFTLHHIATDDRSHEVLAGELVAALEGRPLPPLPVRYADYAIWQRDRMAGSAAELVERELGFWRERLAGMEPAELPADRPRAAVRDPRAGTVRFAVPPELAARLDELGGGHGATPSITLLAGFLAILARYTGQSDLAVGVPVSARNRPELDDLVGLFVNTIVVRASLADRAGFTDLLAEVRESATAGYAHAEVPFELVVEELAPQRDLSRNPLFSIMFATHEAAARPSGVELPDLPGAKFDLGCHLTRRPDGGLDGRIEYAAALFDASSMAGFADHYVRLLRAAVAAPDTPVRRLPLLTGAEAAAPVLAGEPVPDDSGTVPELIAARAAVTEGIAVTGGGTTLTYPELDREANRLAGRLRALGASRGTLVAVRLPRTADLVVALLAVLKSGAAYIPLDPAHPAERLAQALADSAAPLLIATADAAPLLPAGVRLVALDDPAERAGIRACPPTAPDVRPHPDDLAYVVYTSGSTGRPKGAMVTHGGLAGYTRWACAELRPGDGVGSPLHTSIAYDLALTSLYPTLAAGAPVRLVDEEPAGVEQLARALADGPYGVVKLTPTHLDLLAGTLPADVLAGTARCLVIGGEELRGEQLAVWSAHAPATRIVNSYGPSETAVACCVHIVPAGETVPGPVPIGRPIPGATVCLLDDAMRAVPPGVAGEIYVGGRGVGQGYLGSPRLTADRFVPDPHATEPGARLYRTGDLARQRPDGTLVFLGRADQQIKIRGFRVEPGEIEGVLAEHPAVRAAAVVADRSDPGNPRLAAHILPAGPGVPLSELRTYLAERLPGHLVPTLWGTLAELPLLGNGKLDRRALPGLAPLGGAETYTAPATPAEQAIAEVWAEVLGAGRVGRHDRFFDLGGQSLLATRVVARLRERFPVPVSVRDVFAAPTVATLADLVAARVRAQMEEMFGASAGARQPETPQATALSSPVTPADRSRPLPLSFAQRGLWVLDQLRPGGTEYLVVTALRLRGELDVDALGRALTRVAERHEILRTRYVAGSDGEPAQVVDPPSRLRPVAEHADPAAVLEEELATPIDLARGPVLRVRLVRASTGEHDEHVLVLVTHHIATDGWSSGILAAELADAYLGRDLPEPALQYADFAAWQRERFAGQALDGALAHWRGRLTGLEPTELPTDRPRPPIGDHRGAVLRFDVPPTLAGALEEVGRRAGATPFTTYLAGFYALLARHTGRRDLAVGVPMSGRDSAEVEGLIGFFVNTVVMRADLTGDPSFSTLLGRVQDVVAEAYQHDGLPFERLVEELAPSRDLSRHPLFQLLFAFREEGEERFRLPGLDVSPEPVPWRTAKFDLTMELTRRADGGLTGEIEYATALFDRATADRLARHYLTLLESAAARPDGALGELELLDDAERHALTAGAGGPVRSRPDLGLPELVARQAALAPGRGAVECDGAALTYGDLDAAANRLAHHLRAAGIRRDDVVGVCLPRRPELVVALLGVLRAGAAYLPLDPAHPADRLAWMLQDSRARLVVVDAEPSPASGHGTPVLSLAAERAGIDARPGESAPVGTDLDGLAYVMYTSGSTGRPKGVAVPHRGIRNRVLWTVHEHGLGASDRLLQKTSVTFDASVWEFLGPLVSGGTVVLPPDGTERDPASMVEALVRDRITVLQGVPSFLRTLADEPGLERCGTLRLLFSAGEPLPGELAARLSTRLGTALVNTYGPTECSIDVTAWQYEPGDGPGIVPIGRPLDNTRTVVYTPDGRLAPIGTPGELHAAGDGLARGYLGRPGLTADRFVPDPYGPPGARAYRTGDVVRRRTDGALEFLGRADRQVKIRGVRIELDEVEAVLSRHPALAAAVVEARRGPDGLPRLVGYLVARGDAPEQREIREFLLARLPEPYLPSVLLTVDRLPRTSSGKIDRAALPDPDGVRRAGRAVPAAPRTPAEKIVTDVMAEVLGLDVVGTGDDFFDLGGHSLLAIRIAARLRAAFGVVLPVRAVFEDRTAAALAARVDGLGVQATGEIVPLDAERRAGPVPLSFAQQRLWFLDLLDQGGQYHVTWAFRLSGQLDAEALAGALTGLFARHGALRTRYVTGQDGGAVQIVDPAAPVPLPVIDLSGADSERVTTFVRSLAERPFDLAGQPPALPYLIRLGARKHVFLLVMHHIVADAWSEQIMARELSELYEARVQGRPATLGPPPLQYADYASWQRSQLTGDVLDRELDHWRDRLAGLQPLELPADRPRPPVRQGRGATVTCDIPAEVAQPLLALGRRQGATAFMTFLSVFAALLGRHTGATDVAIGTVVAGRGQAELDDVVGFFVNTVVVRVDLAGDPTVTTLIGRVRESALDAFSHDELPFDRLVEGLAPQRDLSRSPLCDVTFGLREQAPEPPRLTGLDVRPVAVERTTAKFDLTFGLTAGTDGGYLAELEYATDLFTEATIRRLAGHFRTLVESAATAPDRPVSRLDMLDPAERGRLLRDWNPRATPITHESLHEAFAAQAARTPDAPAVEYAGERLTYAELDDRATTLARRLHAAGVRPEDPVAVYLDRSPAAVTALLAVLRAGGVYVPLDTAQPTERLAAMLGDLRPAVVLTDRGLSSLPGSAPVLTVGETVGEAEDAPPGDLPLIDLPPGDPGRAAYMIYTSGSTGRPKAVVVPHGAYTHHCRVHADAHDIRPGDRVLLHAPLIFDPAMAQMGATLLAGATVVIGDTGVVAPADLPDLLAETGVTHVALAATYYRDVMTGIRPGDPRPAALRVLAVGGEAVGYQDARLWLATGLPARFLCVYGPTEATIGSLCHPVTPAEVAAAAPDAGLPIGRPLPGTRAYVVDAAFNPVPVGVVGELCLGGPRVSRGYLRQPGLTADRFVPDPFGEEPGERLYRTGDQVRYRPDGVIEFIGRIDAQVKLRGFRIELGEIETALAAHPGVQAAAAAVQELAPGDRRLVGYVVPASGSGGAPSSPELRAHLRDRVPEYMVPALFVTLDGLPATAGQKVDRRALPVPDPGTALAPEEAVPPGTEVEEAIAAAWADVLGLPAVGVEHDFFELGGHSLLATRLMALLQDLFGLEIPLRVLFEATTVRAQATALERLAEAAAPTSYEGRDDEH